jgi:hypothetical protein
VEDVDANPPSPVPDSLSSRDQDGLWTPLWHAGYPSGTESPLATGDHGSEVTFRGISGQDEFSCPNPIAESICDDMEAVVDEIVPLSTDRDSSEASTRGSQTLQISRTYLQLPSDVLKSTVRRLLWDYFVNRASQIFLCWEPDDAHLDKRYNDPYKETLPAVAVENGPLMLASLALSAFHCAGGGRSREDNSLITSLMLEASQSLAASRWDGPQTFKRLLATVGTASLLYLLNPTSYSDMLPLSRSAALCLMTNPKWQNVKETSYQAIMQIFRWGDICAQCSLKRYVPIPDEHMQLRLELQENERAANLSSSYAGWFVHPLYAFAEDLIAPLRRTAWLIRLRQQGRIMPTQATETPGDPSLDQHVQNIRAANAGDTFRISKDRFDVFVEEVEQMIHATSSKVRLVQYQSHSSAEMSAPDLRTDLNHLATAIDSAILILFYTRLRDTPWTTNLIRFHVRNVVDNLCKIPAGSRCSNGVVFPLYVAGLEAVDLGNRSMIIDRMKHLPGIWLQREAQLVASLEHVWKIRDADPGAVWNSWVHQGMYHPHPGIPDKHEHNRVSTRG